nr:MAG TPA: hypothetical protein [Caudoviricetes sp.]DAU19644.1 MAG TPA: hypothetical protein [Caudoviricetes sp.]
MCIWAFACFKNFNQGHSVLLVLVNIIEKTTACYF